MKIYQILPWMESKDLSHNWMQMARGHWNEEVGYLVASHRRYLSIWGEHTELLRYLSGDFDKYVRINLAWNPRTPKDILQDLLKDRDPDVRVTVREIIKIRHRTGLTYQHTLNDLE